MRDALGGGHARWSPREADWGAAVGLLPAKWVEVARDRAWWRGRRGPVFGPTALSSVCERFAVMRPRRWLQRRMQPYLDRLRGTYPLVGLHLRSGFADWQFYSQSRRAGAASPVANAAWAAAAAAPPLTYAEQ